MVVVAQGKQGVEPAGALTQNGSGSLEKLHKDGSERQETSSSLQPCQQSWWLFPQAYQAPTPGFFLPGERKVEAEDCNFRGLQSLDSEPAEMLLSLGVVVLGGTTGAGGCQAVMMSLARSSCRCVRM